MLHGLRQIRGASHCDAETLTRPYAGRSVGSRAQHAATARTYQALDNFKVRRSESALSRGHGNILLWSSQSYRVLPSDMIKPSNAQLMSIA